LFRQTCLPAGRSRRLDLSDKSDWAGTGRAGPGLGVRRNAAKEKKRKACFFSF
jgi:hypothetical protein